MFFQSFRTLCLTALLSAGCAASDDAGPPDASALLFQAALARGPRVAFTHPGDGAVEARALEARNRTLALIEGARQRLDLWIYGFDAPLIRQALLRARERGVQIQIYGSPDQDYKTLEAVDLAPRIRNKSGLQHAKVLLADDQRLLTGTGNFTRSGFFYNHNAFLEFPLEAAVAQDLRAALLREGAWPESNATNAPDEPSAATAGPVVRARDARFLVSPGAGPLIQQRLLEAIHSARRSIQFLIFVHTDPVLAEALAQAAERGVRVQGVYDDPSNRGELPAPQAPQASGLLRLHASGGAQLYLDGNDAVFRRPGERFFSGGHLHHKTLLVDGARLLSGSYNWSVSARDRNLELFFESGHAGLIRAFRQEFERIRRRAAPLRLAPNTQPAPAARFSRAENDWCAPRAEAVKHAPDLPAALHDAIAFAGSGAWTRAYALRATSAAAERGNAKGACNSAEDAPSHAGPGAGGSLRLPPDAPGYCSHGECRALRNVRVAPEKGWLWAAAETPELRRASVWTRSGWIHNLSVEESAESFYRFDALYGGDAFWFLEAQDGSRFAFCVRSGRELDSDFERLRYSLAYRMTKTIECVAPAE